jgi:hypothetical protein
MSASESNRAARRQADLLSVQSLAELLRQVANEPDRYLQDTTVHAALRSQGALAKLSLPDRAVVPMSLNHQKRMAEEGLGGYSMLDDLRSAARSALAGAQARVQRGKSDTKAGLLNRVRDLEEQNRLLRQDLFILQRAYDLRCVQARHYAAASGETIKELCRKEQREIDASFSLRRKPKSEITVVELEEGRRRVRRND